MEVETLGDVSNWFYRKSISGPDPGGELYKMAHITGRAGMRLAFLEYVWRSVPDEMKPDIKREFAEMVWKAYED